MRINYLAVLLTAVLHWILGGVWYGVFSRPFSAYIGDEKMRELETRSEPKAFIVAFLSSLVLVYVLARVMQYSNARTVVDGLQTAFLVWLGFVAASQILSVMFEGRHFGLYVLNIAYQLVACELAGIILALWQRNGTHEPARSLASVSGLIP